MLYEQRTTKNNGNVAAWLHAIFGSILMEIKWFASSPGRYKLYYKRGGILRGTQSQPDSGGEEIFHFPLPNVQSI